jgi:5-formyltetrahydrofolate cyclo-ligase
VTKAEARRAARSRLAAIGSAARAEAEAAIARNVWLVPEVAAARTLLLYASLPDEVATDAIAREALRRGLTVTYPRCLPATFELALHHLRDLGELRDAGSYGIREPDPACPLLDTSDIDVVLVPGLAFDRRGARLGRGAGYYDRLFALPTFRAFRCGLFFAAQEAHHLPTDPWDVFLDAIVTEEGMVKDE